MVALTFITSLLLEFPGFLFFLFSFLKPGCIFYLFILKEGYKKEGDRLFSRVCCDRTRGNGFKLKENRFRLDIMEVFYNKGGEALAQVAQRHSGCSVPGNTKGQAEQGSEHLTEMWVSLFIVGELVYMAFKCHYQLK